MRNDTCIKFNVTLSGITPVLFDRYPGSNTEALAPEKKLYTDRDGKTIVFPAMNLSSFLTAQNTDSAPKRICGKQWRNVCQAGLSFLNIEPLLIPFVSDGTPITTDDNRIKIVRHVARMKKGNTPIPNLKERPQLDTPWELSFFVTLWKNPDLHEDLLKRLFVEGGRMIGIGTFRGLYGKFEVTKWEAQ